MFPAFFSSSRCLPPLYPAHGSHVVSWAQTVWNDVQPVLSPWPASSHPSVPLADIHSFIHCFSSRIHSFIHCSSSRQAPNYPWTKVGLLVTLLFGRACQQSDI